MASKPCKYNCGQELSWDTGKSQFVEKDGTAHTKERCAYMKSLLPKQPPAPKPDESGAAKGHAENIAMHKEAMEMSRKLTDAVIENTRQQKENAVILDTIRMHVEVLAKAETARSSFKPATAEVKTS